jgi:hypothetical protein
VIPVRGSGRWGAAAGDTIELDCTMPEAGAVMMKLTRDFQDPDRKGHSVVEAWCVAHLLCGRKVRQKVAQAH